MNDAATRPAIPRPLIEGPSAWFGPDLAKRPEEWVYTLSVIELAEIDAAIQGIAGRDLAVSVAPIPHSARVVWRAALGA